MTNNLKKGNKREIIETRSDLVLNRIVSEFTLLSENSFARAWLNKKEDEAWKDL